MECSRPLLSTVIPSLGARIVQIEAFADPPIPDWFEIKGIEGDGRANIDHRLISFLRDQASSRPNKVGLQYLR